MNKTNNKPIFFCGLGEHPSQYKSLSKYFNIVPINWNKIKLPNKGAKIVAGFSIGATLACDYALKNKVKTLVLCSMTPGVETLNKVKADKIIFLAGEEEKWVIRDIKRLTNNFHCTYQIHIVPKTGHKINKSYQQYLLDVLNSLA